MCSRLHADPGGVAVHLAERFGVSVVGVDVNEFAVSSATRRAARSLATNRAKFQVVDANEPLPFPADSLDAVFCNAAINHLRDRRQVLMEWHRVLRENGRCLYTDPVVVTGSLSNAEIAVRSSIGWFLFTLVGFNEQELRNAGFCLCHVADLTDGVGVTSWQWRESRARRRATLCQLEGETNYQGVQEFLAMVHILSSQRRLSRFAFLSEKSKEAD